MVRFLRLLGWLTGASLSGALGGAFVGVFVGRALVEILGRVDGFEVMPARGLVPAVIVLGAVMGAMWNSWRVARSERPPA